MAIKADGHAAGHAWPVPVRPDELLGRALNDIESRHAPGRIFCRGPMAAPLAGPRVSIVGSRDASEAGILEAGKIAWYLANRGVIIVGGLARGIDTAGHRAAMAAGGRTIAVLGTPLNRAYPSENAGLQEEIASRHLAISQYGVDHHTKPRDFALRNKTMALISDAAVIVEASDSGGSLHHARESLRLGRPLFICRAVFDDDGLEWPAKMVRRGAMVLNRHSDILVHPGLGPDRRRV